MRETNQESLNKLRMELSLKHDVSLEHIDKIISRAFKFIKEVFKDPDDMRAIRLRKFGVFEIKPIYNNPGKTWGHQNYEEIRKLYDERLAKAIPERLKKRNA
jgi:nucleoid DNA-binding protein